MRVGVLNRRAGEDGFTLVEVLIAVTILGVLLSSLTGVLLVTLKTATGADTKLTESSDLLRATRYFTGDVQGAKTVTVATTPRCGTDLKAVVEFIGQDVADGATPPPTPPVTPTVTTTVVSYVQRTVTGPAGTSLELHRLACTYRTATPTYPLTPVTAFAVVRRLSATAPVVTCLPACSTFTQVSVLVREKSGGLVYTLTGRRRTA